ncbi:MAG TPA: MFS transporter [Bryobacteraceae bacterium]|nr:MFS transporter [Bryobacteraceae bacterium]
MISRVFKSFVYRDFRLMWFGACTSSIGTLMQTFAQAWLVLQLSGSSFMLGLDSFLGSIPIVLFSLVGGVFADRTERQKLLLGSQFVQMACAFTLATLFATGVVHIWHILTLSFIVGTAQSFGGPAYSALIPTLVKAEDLPNAIALNSIQFNAARVLGPTVGGVALTMLGASWCFGLNGVSFVAVIISLLMIHPHFVPSKGRESVVASMQEGFQFIRHQGAMGALIVLAFSMTLLAFPLIVFLPVFAKDVFHGGPNLYTILLVCSGVGSILGALLVAAAGKHQRMGISVLLMIIALGALIAAFARSRSFLLSCVLIFLSGAMLLAVFTSISSLVQLIAPDNMRGRVISVYNVAFRGGMPFGSLIVGALVKEFTAPVVLAWNGVFLTILGLYFLFVQRKVATL